METNQGLTPERRLQLTAAVSTAFSPHAPINKAQLFRGRTAQVEMVLDAAQVPGLSCVIYGERGVGKTSLANIIGDLIRGHLKVPVIRVSCTEGDRFGKVVRRALDQIHIVSERHATGLMDNIQRTARAVSANLPAVPNPDRVAAEMQGLPGGTVLIFDEFDRLPKTETVAFADLVKALSDRSAEATIVLVGVAEDVRALVEGHASIERCLRQVHLRRMSTDEIRLIVTGGLKACGMTIEAAALTWILEVCQGFPHYAHLLAQQSARVALADDRVAIGINDVIDGVIVAVGVADQSLRDAYHVAVTGTKKENIWKEVVTACARAATDERGYFSGAAVGVSLTRILGREVIQQDFAYHLGKLTEPERGPLIERTGPQRRYRYRFLKPLMRPFILMKAVSEKRLLSLASEGEAKKKDSTSS